jgi:tRNA dimethylallyltransferase
MERQSLYESINARVDKMVECGFIDEVRGLLTSGYTGNLSSMSAIGYRHVISYLRGDFSEIELVELIKRETRHFARRQYSWFRLTDKRIHWFHTEDCPGGPIGLVKKFLENELTNVS